MTDIVITILLTSNAVFIVLWRAAKASERRCHKRLMVGFGDMRPEGVPNDETAGA